MSQEFTSLQELRRLTDDHQRVLTATQQPVIGWFCSYTPLEVLRAAGMRPYRIVPAPGLAASIGMPVSKNVSTSSSHQGDLYPQ